jgi:hypothetical protein
MYPIPRCDDAVTEIPPSAKYFIAFDLDCGYWQVALEEKSRAKTAFFTPDGKRRWRVMPMGFLNSHAIFVSMMAELKKRVGCQSSSKRYSSVYDDKYGQEV